MQFNSTNNSYSGGTAVDRGTLIANGAGTLGTGGVIVQGLSQVDLRAANTVSGSNIANSLPVFTARDGGEIYLNAALAFNGTNDRFQIAAGATLTGYAGSAGQGLASLTRVNTITGGGQVILAPDAIVRAQNMLPLPELGGLSIQNLGTAADLYFSPVAGSGLNDSAALTIGAGTPWKGLSSGRTGAGWTAGTLNANSDFYLQGLARDSAGATLSLGATNTPGTYSIVNRSGQAINAYVSGQVVLDEDTAVAMPSDLTFVVTNGGLLLANRSRSFGDPSLRPGSGIASVLVQAGGTLDPGAYVPTGLAANQGLGTPASPAYPYPLESPVNGAATVEMGGRLLLNDASGLGSSSAVITMKTGSVLEMGNAGAFLGSNSGYLNNGRISFQPGVIFRQTVGNINHLQTMLDLAPQPVLEIFGGNVSFTNHTNPFLVGGLGNPTIAPENLTLGAGVTLVNDSSDRQLAEGRGKIILANGVTLAAVNQTHLNIQEGIEIQEGAVINVGSAQFIDGLPRLG
jgi:autotransporter-associated beta strand protein